MLKLFEKKWFCTLGLLFASITWGASFFIIRNGVAAISTDAFIAVRLLLSAVIFFIFFPKRYIRTPLQVRKKGFILGIILFIPLWLQTIGLETISSGRSSFLTSLYVPFTPLLFWLISRKKLKAAPVLLALLAVFGSFIMNPFGSFQFSTGDNLTIFSAVMFALHIVAVSFWTKQHDSFDLGLWQFMGCLAGAIVLVLFKSETMAALMQFKTWNSTIWFALLYTSLITTCICFTLQVICQKQIEPHRAALIFALEAPFATFFAFMFNQEKLTFNELMGGTLILIACILPEQLINKWYQVLFRNYRG